MKILPLSIALFGALSLSPMSQAHEGHEQTASQSSCISAKQASTQAALRDLWVEHVFWIRNYVVASADHNQAEKNVAVDQVVANATAISGAIAGFYGEPAGHRMLMLLAGHWTAVKAYSDATFAKNESGQKDASAKLIANAKDISAFLAKANPNLPESALVGLLSAHGAHHIAQIQQLAKGDVAGEARTWAEMRAHMFTIADALTDGLVKQSPDKF